MVNLRTSAGLWGVLVLGKDIRGKRTAMSQQKYVAGCGIQTEHLENTHTHTHTPYTQGLGLWTAPKPHWKSWSTDEHNIC